MARRSPAPDERACLPYAQSATLSGLRSRWAMFLITTLKVEVSVVGSADGVPGVAHVEGHEVKNATWPQWIIRMTAWPPHRRHPVAGR